MSDRGSDFGRELLACAVEGTDPDEHPVRHVADLPPRQGRPQAWPQWADPDVVRAFVDRGIEAPWSHQLAAANLAHDGRHVVLSTGTASGKSLAYQLPILTALKDDPRARVLYLSPTKALGHDQLRAAVALTEAVPGLGDVAPSSYDGDSPGEVRRFARERSRWIFSNPDMIHLSLLRNHARWAVFLRNLRFIVVDECHYYRGIFGSNVAMVLRRLLRLCTRYTSSPTVIFASATTAAPAATASELIGQTVAEVTEDGSPQGARTVALWEPALRDGPRRRKRRSGTAFRRCRGGQGDGRPDRRGRTDADVRPVPPRRRADRAGCAGPAGGRRSRSGRAGGVLPRGVSGRGPPRTRTRAWPKANCAVWPPPTRWSSVSTSRGWTRWCWPAFPAPSRRSGSRPAARVAAGRAR